MIEVNAREDATEEAAEDAAAADRPVKLDVAVLPVQRVEGAEGGQDAADPTEVLNKFLIEAG